MQRVVATRHGHAESTSALAAISGPGGERAGCGPCSDTRANQGQHYRVTRTLTRVANGGGGDHDKQVSSVTQD